MPASSKCVCCPLHSSLPWTPWPSCLSFFSSSFYSTYFLSSPPEYRFYTVPLMPRLGSIFAPGRTRRSRDAADTSTISRSRTGSSDYPLGFHPEAIESFDAAPARVSLSPTVSSRNEQAAANLVELMSSYTLSTDQGEIVIVPRAATNPYEPAALRLTLVVLQRIMEHMHEPHLFAYWDLIERQKRMLRFMSVCQSWRDAVAPLYYRVFMYRIIDSHSLTRLPIAPPDISLRPSMAAIQVSGQITYPELRASVTRAMADKIQWRLVHTLYIHVDLEYISSYFDQSVIGVIKALAESLAQSMPALRAIRYTYPRDSIIGHRHLFGKLVEARGRYLNTLSLSSECPVEMQLMKSQPNHTLGHLDIGYPVTDVAYRVVAWFASSLSVLKIRGLTLTKFVSFIKGESASQYHVFENLHTLQLGFDEAMVLGPLALAEQNSQEMFPSLKTLEIDSYAYSLPVFLKLFAGAHIENLTLTNCNSSLLELTVGSGSGSGSGRSSSGNENHEHLRSLSCTFDVAQLEVADLTSLQAFISRLFRTRATRLERLCLAMHNLLPLQFPTVVGLTALREISLSVPMQYSLFAKFLSLLPHIEQADVQLVDYSGSGDCAAEEIESFDLAGRQAVSSTLQRLHVKCYPDTDAEPGHSLAYGLVLLVAKLPALKVLVAPNVDSAVLRRCIGWVLANEGILRNVGHLRGLRCRGTPAA
ncbi:hypothetical protein GQ54DRAFT_306104 [Martensiomyces pterosporus]|nr:hypothetical protein GQ54DRAFT_306104 [Martensiomyces pterosporus]